MAPRDLDAIAGLAAPLPMLVIGEILGLPQRTGRRSSPGRTRWWRFWARDRSSPPSWKGCAMRSTSSIATFAPTSAPVGKPPREDLLQALLSAEEQGGLLSEDELVATCGLALFAGNGPPAI